MAKTEGKIDGQINKEACKDAGIIQVKLILAHSNKESKLVHKGLVHEESPGNWHILKKMFASNDSTGAEMYLLQGC